MPAIADGTPYSFWRLTGDLLTRCRCRYHCPLWCKYFRCLRHWTWLHRSKHSLAPRPLPQTDVQKRGPRHWKWTRQHKALGRDCKDCKDYQTEKKLKNRSRVKDWTRKKADMWSFIFDHFSAILPWQENGLWTDGQNDGRMHLSLRLLDASKMAIKVQCIWNQ